MQSRAPLMIEHRLIERMIEQINRTLSQIDQGSGVDPVQIDKMVDFIRIYADRTHHGKEEDILFSNLRDKPLSEEDRRLMGELIDEHAFGRKTTQKIMEANHRYRNGDESALAQVAAGLRTLVGFYPQHIEKEDKIFFPAVRKYYSTKEDEDILNAYWEFDRKMIHEKYLTVIETFESA